AAALNRLLGDAALRARLGEAGRAWVAQGFSMPYMVGKTLAVYRQVLGRAA
ncbi:MAG: hypothetical protein RL669_208, partial [Pseudomonadota bacterium]